MRFLKSSMCVITILSLFLMFAPTFSTASNWLYNTNNRIATMGGIDLVIEDEDTSISLFNMENPAGLIFENRQNQLDLNLAKRQYETSNE